MFNRFTVIHLLLIIILVNLAMITLFVMAISGTDVGMVRDFGALIGAKSGSGWSNFLFLTLLLFVNAVPILFAATVLLWPVLQQGAILTHAKLEDVLRRSAAIGPAARKEVLDSLYSETGGIRASRLNAELVFAVGAILFLATFPLFCFTFAMTFPANTPLFVAGGVPVANGMVEFFQILLFTIDQAVTVFLLDAFDLFGASLSAYRTNAANPTFVLFVLAFRMALAVVIVMGALLLVKRLLQLMFWQGYVRGGKAVDAVHET